MSLLNNLRQISISAWAQIKAIRYDWYVLMALLFLSIVGWALLTHQSVIVIGIGRLWCRYSSVPAYL